MATMTTQRASSSAIAGKSRSPSIRSRVVQSASRSRVIAQAAADRKLWAPGVVAPEYLQGELAGDYGLDPLGLGADPKALRWYRQSELVHARWAMLGVLGVLVQEIAVPDVFWYDAGRPENLPGPFKNINMGGLLACAPVAGLPQLWQCERGDPIFKGNKVPNLEMGYPGGVFDPLGFSKGNLKELQTKASKQAAQLPRPAALSASPCVIHVLPGLSALCEHLHIQPARLLLAPMPLWRTCHGIHVRAAAQAAKSRPVCVVCGAGDQEWPTGHGRLCRLRAAGPGYGQGAHCIADQPPGQPLR
ncbi:chlorophyll a-b binding protein, chloroplastic [Haematococcus lacustris]|uniref:Chlorophyll a-b binding protein, chloroplastic n=1 Tax=Haematococcus lacustris TaxID=44745 RepID=A0A699YRA4_HAELA|nr:chlorophyll a-b binding protein, chloroplastic [Haematococcus lacustris]